MEERECGVRYIGCEQGNFLRERETFVKSKFTVNLDDREFEHLVLFLLFEDLFFFDSFPVDPCGNNLIPPDNKTVSRMKIRNELIGGREGHRREEERDW